MKYICNIRENKVSIITTLEYINAFSFILKNTSGIPISVSNVEIRTQSITICEKASELNSKEEIFCVKKVDNKRMKKFRINKNEKTENIKLFFSTSSLNNEYHLIIAVSTANSIND
jgi:hypothetical protein